MKEHFFFQTINNINVYIYINILCKLFKLFRDSKYINIYIIYSIDGVLLQAKGLAILTVVRAGFLVTARAGSGIVIAKINDDLGEADIYVYSLYCFVLGCQHDFIPKISLE